MKLINKILYVTILSVFFVACGNDKPQTENAIVKTEKLLTENLKNVEVQIQGMTCEIGCARLIQSKLYKADGIKFAKVSFADSVGNITYDANRISDKEIKNIIQNVAGGDLYKVIEITEVEDFTKIQELE